MSFQLLLQPGFYHLLLHSQKRQTTCEGNLMPPFPPSPGGQLEKVKSDKYLTRYFLFEKLRFLTLDPQFELFNNNTTGKIIIISCQKPGFGCCQNHIQLSFHH